MMSFLEILKFSGFLPKHYSKWYGYSDPRCECVWTGMPLRGVITILTRKNGYRIRIHNEY